MSNVEKISVSLPPKMAASLKAVVEMGGYASTSEIIREALRDWEAKQEEKKVLIAHYRKLVQDGIDSGPGQFNSMDDLIAEARRRHVPRKKSA